MIILDKQSESLIKYWIWENYGFPSIEQWIESIVQNLLRKTNQTEPPIQLNKILKIRNILLVDYPKIFKAHYKREIRFSLAHEIAHTFFFNFLNTPPTMNIPPVSKKIIETLCNQIASEILMPRTILTKCLENYNIYETVDNKNRIQLFQKILMNFVNIFDVNPQVVSRRLIEDMALCNAIAIGVLWRAKLKDKEIHKCATLNATKQGFAVKIYDRNNFIHYPSEGYAWRMGWFARPSSAMSDLFIPTKGCPKIHIKIVEDLYRSMDKNNSIYGEEPIISFKLGNLKQYLKVSEEAADTYPVYISILEKTTNASETMPVCPTELDDDFQNRYKTKIMACIPLG